MQASLDTNTCRAEAEWHKTKYVMGLLVGTEGVLAGFAAGTAKVAVSASRWPFSWRTGGGCPHCGAACTS